LSQSASDTDILDSYSHSANEIRSHTLVSLSLKFSPPFPISSRPVLYRRFFYILSAVSLTGALDSFLCAYYASHNSNIQLTSHSSSPLKTSGEAYLPSSSPRTATLSWKTTLLPTAIFVLISFFLCFIISFLMSPMVLSSSPLHISCIS
jgi:hypothetical protein